MKKLFIFIVFTTLSFSNWLSSKPEWITNHSKYSFIGVSSPKDDKQSALKDATTNGLEQVSNQLGVVVNSNFTSSKSVENDQVSNSVKVDTKLKSFSKIENYELKQNYCEEENEQFVCYVLISFEEAQFLKLKKETKERIEKLNRLISELEIEINNLNYEKAKSIYEKAMLIPEANYNQKFQTLSKNFNSMINLKISDIKDEVSPLEEMKFSLFSNRDGFLYVIYNNGHIPKLIFPQNDQNNEITKDKAFIFPSTHKFNSHNNQKLIIIFSKEKIDIPVDDSYTINKSQNLWKMKLKTEIKNLNAINKILSFKLKKTTKNICIKEEHNPISKVLADKTTKIFKKLGMQINCKNYEYLIKIKVEKEKFYAEEEHSYLYDIKFSFILEDNLVGEIDSISTIQTFYEIPDDEIAIELNNYTSNDFSNDFKLNNLYQTIKGEQ